MQDSTHSTVPKPPASEPIRRPALAVALLAAVAALCAALGFWQLGRAEQSRALAERIEAAAGGPTITLRTSDAAAEALRYRRVEVEGRYVPERQILLDNIVHDGAAGYYVLAPFEPADDGPWLIVNRGWVRADPGREVLPDVGIGGERRRLTGRLDRLPAAGLRLGAQEAGPSRAPVTVLSFPSMDELERMLGVPLFGFQLLLDADRPDGYVRDFPSPALGPERHLAYAAQWWLFGTIAAGGAGGIVWRTIRRRKT